MTRICARHAPRLHELDLHGYGIYIHVYRISLACIERYIYIYYMTLYIKM